MRAFNMYPPANALQRAFVSRLLPLLAVALLCLPSIAPKVFERCELARVLHQQHRLNLQEVANWVCIAQHSSDLNTAAYATGLEGGSHGLFQISDVYWCSPPGKGFACNVPCERLRDDNLADDLACAHIIYNEHQRISGDGYNAWNAYQQHCRYGAQSYIQDCFKHQHTYSGAATALQPTYYTPQVQSVYSNSISNNAYAPNTRGKVYGRCELAQELYYKHRMPMDQIPTWVCIAQHESNFDTTAVGRLNTDGSADHGLFQISDLYWCAHDRYSGGKACGLQCNKLLDGDLTDDVRCVRHIHDEHTRISGDGFTAWTVYENNCRDQEYERIESCFTPPTNRAHYTTHHSTYSSYATQTQQQFNGNPFLKHVNAPSNYAHTTKVTQPQPHKGKVYKRCELAQELYFKHKFPMQDIATWVCIAEHESRYDTSAVGRLNGDGSADHGLFQISDRYWCTHDSNGGKGCQLPCAKLLDADLSDDMRCVRIIHEEHTRISGDGFTAWTVYNGNCRNQRQEQVAACFDDAESHNKVQTDHGKSKITTTSTNAVKPGKIYKQCELAQELYYKHKLPISDIPTWVCIAKHESNYNTAAVGRVNADGSINHGLFQISDRYWCSNDDYGGKACNVPCRKLTDSDLSDDITCIKTIHAEHTRLSGDGYTAWTVYNNHCRDQHIAHISTCFPAEELERSQTENNADAYSTVSAVATSQNQTHVGKGKIYSSCELAQELYFKHKMPMQDIPTWVCIAQHESSFNTAAVGRLNTDGSADHGLFQISDLYWCAHDTHGGKACHISCHKLLDNDITDDVRCVKTIFEEHTRISGDGFTAWTVYDRNCRHQKIDKVAACFDSKEMMNAQGAVTNSVQTNVISTTAFIEPTYKRKVYKRCELAQELYRKHKFPLSEIPTWVCIAQRESSFDTSAVGRLNADGSADHGLFQISDLYWCTHDDTGGKACNIPCHKLLDTDISDDVRCVRIIYEEHTQISGDGFNAWTVYKRYCRDQQLSQVADCFDQNELAEASQQFQHSKKVSVMTPQPYSFKTNEFSQIVPRKPPKKAKHPLNHPFVNNPFLNQFNASVKFTTPTLVTTTTTHKPAHHITSQNEIAPAKAAYTGNPFLQRYIESKHLDHTQTVIHHAKITTKLTQVQQPVAPYASNPFLSKFQYSPAKYISTTVLQQQVEKNDPKQKYNANPFLAKYAKQASKTGAEHTISSSASAYPNTNKVLSVQSSQSPYRIQTSNVPKYQNNSFLQTFTAPGKQFSPSKSQSSATTTKPLNTATNKLHVYPTRAYIASDNFRTTPHSSSVSPTTRKSTTTTGATTHYTTTQRPRTQTTKQTHIFTLPSGSTTTTRKPATTPRVIKKPTTSSLSTGKPVTSAKASTTRRPESTTTWNWQQQLQMRPTKSTTTQRTPKTTITPAIYKTQPTTISPISQQKTRVISSTQNQKKNNADQKEITRSTITHRTTRSTERPITTKINQSTTTTRKPHSVTTTISKYDTFSHNTTRRPGAYFQQSSTKNPEILLNETTKRWSAYSFNSQTNYPTATTKTPTATTKVIKTNSWNPFSTKTPVTSTAKQPEGTTKHFVATTRRPETTNKYLTTTTTSRNKDTPKNIISTKKQLKAANKSLTTTSRRPDTTTRHSTTKTSKFAATTPTTPTTRKPINNVRATTTQRAIQTTKWSGFTTTILPFTIRAPLHKNIANQTSTRSATTTTRRPSTKQPEFYHTKSTQSTNLQHQTTTKSGNKVTPKTTPATKSYRDDPFSHPFFAKYTEQLKLFASTTTRRPSTIKPYQAAIDGQESEYFQQFRNHTSGNAKTIYAYKFGQKQGIAE